MRSYSGVPCFTQDLALALAGAGHARGGLHLARRTAFPGRLGAFNIPVVTRLRDLSFKPDIVHAQHQPLLLQVLACFADVPVIQAVHDAASAFDKPVFFFGISKYVGVDERCLARIRAEPGISEEQAAMILNAVDLRRFRPRAPLPEKPGRALIFSNYAHPESHLPAVLQARVDCALEADIAGLGMDRTVAHPEDVLGQYDIVFAKARAAP